MTLRCTKERLCTGKPRAQQYDASMNISGKENILNCPGESESPGHPKSPVPNLTSMNEVRQLMPRPNPRSHPGMIS
eukprot:12334043-Karenia_brevis.AAC.1